MQISSAIKRRKTKVLNPKLIKIPKYESSKLSAFLLRKQKPNLYWKQKIKSDLAKCFVWQDSYKSKIV